MQFSVYYQLIERLKKSIPRPHLQTNKYAVCLLYYFKTIRLFYRTLIDAKPVIGPYFVGINPL